MAYIGNWRDFQPKIAHLSAVHWGGLRPRGGGSSDERDCLEQLGGFARHALQGRKTSDYHRHENTEQDSKSISVMVKLLDYNWVRVENIKVILI